MSNQNSASATAGSSAESGFGDLLSRGGGGSRAPVYNIATGRSNLSASTGNSFDWQTLAIVGAVVVGGLWMLERRK